MVCIEKRPHILYGRSSAPHFRYLTCLLDRGHIMLYGGFMIEVATFGLFSIGIIAGNIWTNHQNQKDKNIQCLSPAKMYEN